MLRHVLPILTVAFTFMLAHEASAQISIADPSGAFYAPGSYAPAYNPPVAHYRGNGSYYWCNSCGTYHHRQGDSHTTLSSALDPNRGYVDPGSMRYGYRWTMTPNGWVRQQTKSWTSFGVNHGHVLNTNPDGSRHAVAYSRTN